MIPDETIGSCNCHPHNNGSFSITHALVSIKTPGYNIAPLIEVLSERKSTDSSVFHKFGSCIRRCLDALPNHACGIQEADVLREAPEGSKADRVAPMIGGKISIYFNENVAAETGKRLRGSDTF